MSARKHAAAKKSSKKINFFTCNGCMGIYPVGVGFKAPKNKHNLRKVCKSCYKQYISNIVPPLPANAAGVLKGQFGGFLTSGNAGILSNANGAAVPTNAGSLISNKSGGLIGNDSAGLVNAGGMNLVGNDGASLIGNDGST